MGYKNYIFKFNNTININIGWLLCIGCLVFGHTTKAQTTPHSATADTAFQFASEDTTNNPILNFNVPLPNCNCTNTPDFVGQKVIFTGLIAETYQPDLSGIDIFYINIDLPYPKNSCCFIIRSFNLQKFNLAQFKTGKQIAVTGFVELYELKNAGKSLYEIEITEPNQVSIW